MREVAASRNISATGWVSSSLGNITTTLTQQLTFANTDGVSGHGSAQAINQTTDAYIDIDDGGAAAACVQVAPLGVSGIARVCFGRPSVRMGLRYEQYVVRRHESSLSRPRCGMRMERMCGRGGELAGRKGPWTLEEDLILVSYVSQHGECSWDSLARASAPEPEQEELQAVVVTGHCWRKRRRETFELF
ncbi:hypothetical protein ACP70R_004174 [Stipagrostis hirtigluma subsp. patula]